MLVCDFGPESLGCRSNGPKPCTSTQLQNARTKLQTVIPKNDSRLLSVVLKLSFLFLFISSKHIGQLFIFHLRFYSRELDWRILLANKPQWAKSLWADVGTPHTAVRVPTAADVSPKTCCAPGRSVVFTYPCLVCGMVLRVFCSRTWFSGRCLTSLLDATMTQCWIKVLFHWLPCAVYVSLFPCLSLSLFWFNYTSSFSLDFGCCAVPCRFIGQYPLHFISEIWICDFFINLITDNCYWRTLDDMLIN